MKKLSLFAVIIALATSVSGQRLQTALLAERTAAGTQFGALLLYETKKQRGLGVFYQAPVPALKEKTLNENFSGIYLQVPLARSPRLLVSGTMRGGFVSGQYVVVVPGLETRVDLGKKIAAGFGSSVRMGYPSFSARLIVKIIQLGKS
jgi:hypothetical protein